jgi:formate hydrogenlyase subunit 6/NADH:ubiquinone oxidoreductase subunit I
MRYPKFREIKGALHSLFTKPYTSAFPKTAHIPFSSFRGRPYYYEEKCIGCTACVNVCPAKALAFTDAVDKDVMRRILTVRWDTCISCGHCQLNCPTEEGIKLSNEFDISATESRKDLFQTITKEMVCCEYCNEPIACRDHLSWTAKKIGPLYTSNTTLLYFQQSLIFAGSDIKKGNKEILRSDRFCILCPKCRREAVFIS